MTWADNFGWCIGDNIAVEEKEEGNVATAKLAFSVANTNLGISIPAQLKHEACKRAHLKVFYHHKQTPEVGTHAFVLTWVCEA